MRSDLAGCWIDRSHIERKICPRRKPIARSGGAVARRLCKCAACRRKMHVQIDRSPAPFRCAAITDDPRRAPIDRKPMGRRRRPQIDDKVVSRSHASRRLRSLSLRRPKAGREGKVLGMKGVAARREISPHPECLTRNALRTLILHAEEALKAPSRSMIQRFGPRPPFETRLSQVGSARLGQCCEIAQARSRAAPQGEGESFRSDSEERPKAASRRARADCGLVRASPSS